MRDLSESLKRVAEREAADKQAEAAEREAADKQAETAEQAAAGEMSGDAGLVEPDSGARLARGGSEAGQTDAGPDNSAAAAGAADIPTSEEFAEVEFALASEDADVELASFDIIDGVVASGSDDPLFLDGDHGEEDLSIAQIIDGDSEALPEEDLISEEIIGGEIAWRGHFLNLEVVECRLPNGHIKTRDILRHPGACGIIALDDKGRILIEHQYRVAAERLVREIPAGKLDPGEDAETCARRELEEETGYRAGKLQYLLPYAPALGYSDEIIHLFLATELEKGDARPDDDEFLAFEWVPLEDLLKDVLAGRIEDSKTIIAVLLVHTLLSSGVEAGPEAL